MIKNESMKFKSVFKIYALNIFLASYGLYYGFNFTIFNSLSDHYLKFSYSLVSESDLIEVSGNIFFYFSLGALIGTIISSFTWNLLGRKLSIILFWILSFLFPFLLFINTIFVLYLTRFLIGVMAGVSLSISTNLIFEYIPLIYRRSGTFIFNIFVVSGFFCGYIFGVIFGSSIGQYWYIAIYSFSIIDLIKIILYFFVVKFESPVYSYNKNNKKNIEEYFKYYYKTEYVQAEIDKFYTIMQNINKDNKFSYKQMFSGKYLKIFLFLSYLNLTHQLSGISTVSFYSNIIFEETTSNPPLFTLFVGVLNVVSSFIPLIFSKITRRQFIIIGMVSCIFSLICIILGGFYDVGSLINFGILFFSFSFSYSFGTSFFSYISAIGNTFICQISILFQWIPIIFISKYARLLINLIGINYWFIIYNSFLVLGLFVFLGYSVDIENKSRDIIFNEFTSKGFYSLKNHKITNTNKI